MGIKPKKPVQTSVLVIGAGWIGAATASRLATKGTRVVATTRSGRASIDTAGIHWESYESGRDDVGRLAELIAPAEAVVVSWAPSGRDVDRRAHYVGGAEAILQACEKHPPARLVYTSSTSALPSSDSTLDESCDEWPDTERGRIQREAEETLRNGCERLAIPWIILRLAGLYGPGRGLERLYRWEDGAPRAGDGAAPTNLIHLDDVCQAIEASLALPPEQSGIVHVCDDDHSPRRQVFAELARKTGRTEPTWELPATAARGKRVSNRKLKDFLGVELQHPRHTDAT